VRSSSQSVPATGAPNPHSGGDLVEECVTHSSSRWCTRVHPSNCSGTVLCSMVMVNRRNVSCQTRDYDDDLFAFFVIRLYITVCYNKLNPGVSLHSSIHSFIYLLRLLFLIITLLMNKLYNSPNKIIC